MASTSSPRHLVLLLSLAVAIGQLATSLYLPSLPAVAADLQISPTLVGWTLTVFYAVFALGNLVVGPLADAHGRRPVLLGGLVIFVAGTLCCAAAPSAAWFFAGRALQAAGASAAPVAGRAMLRDAHEEDDATRALAWLGIAMAASPACGPVLGGFIDTALGWRYGFGLLTLAGLLVTIICWRGLPETGSPGGDTGAMGMMARIGEVLGDRAYRKAVAALACLFAGLGAFFAVAPFLLIHRFGLGPVAFGLTNLLNVGGYLLGSLAAGRLARECRPARVVEAGAALALVGGATMAALALGRAGGFWAFLLPTVVLTIGLGMVVPAGTAVAMGRHRTQAGLASAVLGFFQVGAAGLGTALASALLAMGEAALLAIPLLFLAITALGAASAFRLDDRRDPGTRRDGLHADGQFR